jgi:hypothetical protein
MAAITNDDSDVVLSLAHGSNMQVPRR